MKGRYNGCRMTVYGHILPGAVSIARWAARVNSLTKKTKYKIKVLDWYRFHGKNCSLTARHFGIGRVTLYRWLKQFKQYGIVGLNEKSKRPKRLRKPTTSWDIVIKIVQL